MKSYYIVKPDGEQINSVLYIPQQEWRTQVGILLMDMTIHREPSYKIYDSAGNWLGFEIDNYWLLSAQELLRNNGFKVKKVF